jgi:hypothetical protein
VLLVGLRPRRARILVARDDGGDHPAWFLYLAVVGGVRRLRSPHLVAAAVLYLGVNAPYVKLAKAYGRYETEANAANHQIPPLSWGNLSFYPANLPEMAGWGLIAAAAGGVAAAAWLGRRSPNGIFWAAWLLGDLGFHVGLATLMGWHNEPRYFVFTLPALAGLAAVLFDRGSPTAVRRWLAPGLLAAGLVTGGVGVCRLPRGVVGYDAVARRLARLDRPGNVMLACDQFQDLILRVRGEHPGSRRQYLRSDRTFAIRLSDYAGVPAKVMTRSNEDVVRFMVLGRARYLVTCEPLDPRRDGRPEEMVLAHEAARTSPRLFAAVANDPLLIEYGPQGEGKSLSSLHLAVPRSSSRRGPASCRSPSRRATW